MVPIDRPHLTLLHGCLFRFVAYDAGFAYLRFSYYGTIWTWEGTCMQSFGYWLNRFGFWLTRVSKWLVRVASSSWTPGTAWLQPRLPAWVAPYVNRNLDFTAYDSNNVWHVM